MEWQQYVVDVLLEIDPETGDLFYEDWSLTVPRQSGKSTLILAKVSHRCSATGFFGPAQHVAYTAQTQQKAVEKFETDYQDAMARAPRLRAKFRTGNQKVDIRYPNGSWFAVQATTEKSGHGSVLDEGYIDEAFSQVDARTETAMEPAMSTRRNRQLGVVSTAGWSDASPFLLGKVQAGRALVAKQLANLWHKIKTAYFEWSAPEDADPGAESTWLGCMPALHRPDCPSDCRRHTIRLSFIRGVYEKAVRENKLAEFCRSYLNQWRRKPREGEETALGNWLACSVDLPKTDAPEPRGLAAAVARDRESGGICAAGFLSDGRPFVAPVRHAVGLAWLPFEAARLSLATRLPVTVNVKSTGGEKLAADIEEAGGNVTRVGLEEYVTACSNIYDLVQSQGLAQSGDQELAKQVEGARWRPVGDGRRVFGHRVSETEIPLVEAAALSLWASSKSYELLDSFH